MIGLFDSGVGGLSVLREVRALLPQADLVYLADQARSPYGTKTLLEVRDAAEGASAHLLERGATAVVVACNTASAAALRNLRDAHRGVTFVGMEPAVKPAAAATRSGVVGVLATPTTFQAEVFDDLVGRFAAGIRVLAHPCPDWADLVERDGDDVDSGVIARHVRPVIDAGADTLVLACTHYPFIASQIAAAAGPGVTLIDPAPAVARQVARVADGSGAGTTTFLTTGDPARFATQITHLLGIETAVSRITI
ncbi:MAG: glutamate racemase [Actinobacteria bacterium]|nr:glutamate racemase [Actinomycetota bacterium]MBU1865648.1 glutamate racemase [Actinomycetota bacterium]